MTDHDCLVRSTTSRVAFEERAAITRRRSERITLAVGAGEAVGVVGRDRLRQDVTGLAAMRLLPPTARLPSGAQLRRDRATDLADGRQLQDRAGAPVAMVFQNPTSAFNPVFTIGAQMCDVLGRHRGSARGRGDARRSRIRHCSDGGHARRGADQRSLPAPAVGRHAPARDDRDGAAVPTAAPHRGRADDRARRDHRDADPRAPAPAAARAKASACCFITHDLGVVRDVCDRVAVLYAGRVVETATRHRAPPPPAAPLHARAAGGSAREGSARARRFRPCRVVFRKGEPSARVARSQIAVRSPSSAVSTSIPRRHASATSTSARVIAGRTCDRDAPRPARLVKEFPVPGGAWRKSPGGGRGRPRRERRRDRRAGRRVGLGQEDARSHACWGSRPSTTARRGTTESTSRVRRALSDAACEERSGRVPASDRGSRPTDVRRSARGRADDDPPPRTRGGASRPHRRPALQRRAVGEPQGPATARAVGRTGTTRGDRACARDSCHACWSSTSRPRRST